MPWWHFRGSFARTRKRLDLGGKKALFAARALQEFDDEVGVRWLEEHEEGAGSVHKPEPSADKAPEAIEDELAALRDEIRRLKKEVEESLALLKKLLEKKALENAPAKSGPEDGR